MAVKERRLDFLVKTEITWKSTKVIQIHVEVRGLKVTLVDHQSFKRVAQGTWDRGRYVRWPRSAELPIHPSLLDAVDEALRQRIVEKGESLPAGELRRSAVGYHQ